MKSLPWLIAGVSAGLVAYFVLNQPGPQYATGNDDVEGLAGETSAWGSRQRLVGKGGGLVGKLKEGVGRATGDDEFAGEGVVDQAVGAIKDNAGVAAHAVADTIHDLNR